MPLAFLIGVPLFSVLFVLYRLKGAAWRSQRRRRTARPRHHRHLPLVLFSALGAPFQPAKDRVLLPINTAALPFVEVHRDDRLLAQGGRIRRLPRLQDDDPGRDAITLRGRRAPTANLLLHLGRSLAVPLPSATPDHLAPATEPLKTAPTLLRQADGWLRASLVHLTFPPYCCDCGVYTPECKEYQGYRSSLEAGDCAKLEVPVCTSCQEDSAQSCARPSLPALPLGC